MNQFSFEEINLLCIYNAENRQAAIQALRNMKQLLEPDENELRNLTESTIRKLTEITDRQYEVLDLYPEF